MIKLIYDTKDFIDLHDHDKIIYFETNINNKKISLNIPVNKDDIVDLPVGLAFLNTLKPRQFKWKTREGNIKDA